MPAADEPSALRPAEDSGVLVLDKPPGMTSRQAVDLVKRRVRPAKVGHAGTLDPLATGVLVVCVGAATRLIDYVQRMPKRYVGTFRLGASSPTEDIESPLTPQADAPRPALDEIRAAAARLTGQIMQRPPAYSAIKLAGRRAYALARAGQDVVLEPRPIVVHELTVAHYAYPEIVLEVHCGSGTYIRSLGRDLAELLGTSAVMTALVRTAIGPFSIERAIDPRQLATIDRAARLLPAAAAVADLPVVALGEDELRAVSHGRMITLSATAPELAVLDATGRLAAILGRRPDGAYGPRINLIAGAPRRAES